MAGFGNQTAPDYTADSLSDQHDSTRLGLHTSHDAYSAAHPRYGSGATGGAGFGASLSHFPILPPPLLPIPHSPMHTYPPSIHIPIHLPTYILVETDALKGNKSDPSPAASSNDEFRFGLHKNASPYSGADESRAGSGSTGGAGYGNKTGDFASKSGGKFEAPGSHIGSACVAMGVVEWIGWGGYWSRDGGLSRGLS
jgi:hypothetical protein